MTPVDQLMGMLQTDGWDGLGEHAAKKLQDVQKLLTQRDDNERRARAKIFLDAFSTDAGKLALAQLRAETFERPPAQADLEMTDPHAFALLMARRQGAANVVHNIIAAMEFARGIKSEDK